MALIKCNECGNQVSDQAVACPKCGAPVKQEPTKNTEKQFVSVIQDGEFVKNKEAVKNQSSATGCGAILLIAIILAALSTIFGSHSGTSGDKSDSGTETSNCKSDDLQCLGGKGIASASAYCKDDIEKLALHSVRWTDGTFDMKFSQFRWHNKAKGEITYIGDKAEFQNGFGAFTPVTYACALSSDSKTVLDAVIVSEGRLP